MAETVRTRVRDELGLPISVGVATTKHLAKGASQVAKPDGLVVVTPGAAQAFLDPLPARRRWAVGPATEEKLASVGIGRIGELATAQPELLRRLLGQANGHKLGARAVNVDPRRIETAHRPSSVGAQSALGRRVASEDVLRVTLGYLADRVATRLRAGER